MPGFLEKALARGLNFSNLLCWLLQKSANALGVFWGTLALQLKARLLGVSLGANVRACGRVILMRWPGGRIILGNNISLVSGPRRTTACAPAQAARLRVFGPGAEIRIGDGCEIGAVSITARSKAITIGQNVLIAPNCVIVDSDFHSHWPCEQRKTSPGYELDAAVSIGDHAWIGMNSIILKGVRIGEGAIIGAGSVISRDVPDYCVACGNPAQIRASHAPSA